ncbi:hypothetical protein FF1_009910 [Malus domestica]
MAAKRLTIISSSLLKLPDDLLYSAAVLNDKGKDDRQCNSVRQLVQRGREAVRQPARMTKAVRQGWWLCKGLAVTARMQWLHNWP